MATVDQSIDSALRMNSLIGPGHTWASATSGLRGVAIEVLNSMLQSWQTDGINMPAEVGFSTVATPGLASYTVGSGGDIDTGRPVAIDHANWKIGTTEYVMECLSDECYREWWDKARRGVPCGFHYTNQAPLGILRLLPIPDAANTIVIYTTTLFTNYTTGATSIVVPDGYDLAIKSSLALLYLAEFASLGAKMDPAVYDQVKRQSQDAKANIRRLNLRIPHLESDFPVDEWGWGWEWLGAAFGAGSDVMQPLVITGSVNGTTGSDGNAVFTLSSLPTTTFQLFVQGILMTSGVQYTRSSQTITFVAPFIPVTGDNLQAFGSIT